MFYAPYPESHPLAPLPQIILDAHNGLPVAPFRYSPVVRRHAHLSRPDLAAMLWEACEQRAVSFCPEEMVLRAFDAPLAQAFDSPDGRRLWVLRPPRLGWGGYPLMYEANNYRADGYDMSDHVRIAQAVLHAVYGHEADGTPRAAMGLFAGVVVAYTPHGIMELPPGKLVALIPDTGGRAGVLEEYRRQWEPPGRVRHTPKVTGDPSQVKPPPLIRDEDDLDAFLAGRLKAPPPRPLAPVRGRGQFGPDRQLEWDHQVKLYEWALADWEAEYGYGGEGAQVSDAERRRAQRELETVRLRLKEADKAKQRAREKRGW